MRRHVGVAALFSILLPVFAAAPAAAQSLDSLIAVAERRVESAGTTAQQVPALAEYARLLNLAGRHTEALDAISEAAQLRSIPSAADIRPGLVPDSAAGATRLLLIRAIAEEGLKQFAEARNDYQTILALAPNSGTGRLLRQRVDFIDFGAVGDLATLARFNPEDLNRFYDPESARRRVSILPFFNESDNLLWNFVGYGLAGYLSHAVALLAGMSDAALQPVARREVSAALNAVSLGRLYSEDSPISAVHVARIFGSELSITGRVNSGPGGLGLRITPIVAAPEGDKVVEIETLEDSSLPEGLERLQIDLALALADQIQEWTGFNYLVSRDAFADSLRSLILPDLQRFVAYGRSVELSLAGDIDAALPLLEGAHPALAALDRPELESLRSSGSVPPIPLAQVQELVSEHTDFPAEEGPVTAGPQKPDRTRPEPAAGSPIDRSLRITMLHATSLTLLGAAGIDDGRVGADIAPAGYAGSSDPRDGVEGVNRLEPGRNTLEIVIPLPPSGTRQN